MQACPLGETWRDWDVVGRHPFNQIDLERQAVVAEAQEAVLGDVVESLAVTWVTGAVSPAPSGDGTNRFGVWHRHAELQIRGAIVHIDYIYGNKHSPSRSFAEIRIFVNGKLAGRGGSAGTSLGGGGSNLPAKALVGDLILAVDASRGRESVQLHNPAN